MKYAEVLIEYKVKSLDRTFTYIVPDQFLNRVKVGMKVEVPFGLGETKINGFITNLKNETDQSNLKTIIDIIDEELVLNEELLELGKYIRDNTLCTLVSAYNTMMPTGLKIKSGSSNYQKYDKYLISSYDRGFLESIIDDLRSDGQKEIINALLKEDKVLKAKFNKSSADTLLKKGIIKEESELSYRLHNEDKKNDNINELTPMQKNAFDEIESSFNQYKTFLIHGVTGSGKTEIYLHLIDAIVKNGKTAIMLVPEITLTAQIVNNFYERFGDDVAILHSALSNGEKYDEYLKVLRGNAHILVGTRSAIFAPISNLGIIIIDEEHSESYKQDNSPRYNAIDIATFRCKYNNIPLVLGSATPTYESFARALKGVYKLITLPKRINDANLPTIKIIDMKEEAKKRNMIISDYLKEKIQDRLNKKEQVLLLLNRRGYGNLVSCSMCGYTYKCPNCDITLTYHKSSNSLRCHYCGYNTLKPNICPECKKGELQDFGIGTEKLEIELNQLFDAKIIRMDADTTSKKGSHEKIISDFKEEKYDILLGTQMISKGLDFKKVSLVGVINIDSTLNIPDFRSGERTYALLNQVAGRAGRSGLDSEVVVQTYNPDNITIQMLSKGSFLKNYEYEMGIRKILKYPPYYYLIGIKICSTIYEEASKESLKAYNFIKANINPESIILGPTTAGIFKLKNIYRFQMVIKFKHDDKILDTLKKLDEMYINNKNVYMEIDVNPYYI